MRHSLWPPTFFLTLLILSCRPTQQPPAPRTIDGYRGIWFTLGQFLEYGDKYSGGLGTYTAKHHPLAIYSPEADKTFFVYGGTTNEGDRHLLAMISYYNHATGALPRPVVVHDKQTVDDPHDNPSIQLDAAGHIWVFVSGRGSVRPGFIYRSRKPYDISAFDLVMEDEFAYPQPWWTGESGFMFLFTRYTDGRELYWRTSEDGQDWSPAQKLVSGGHYQMSNAKDGRVITAFNTHFPNRRVDARTNLSFLQSRDMGLTWETIDGMAVSTPVDSLDISVLVRDYRSAGLLVYLKDIGFDAAGNPVLLYITSNDFQPGPSGMPRTWTIAHWKSGEWLFHEVAPATHNYDMGSLYIESDRWRIVAPTEPGPQYWGTGGEMAMWESWNEGASWTKLRNLTRNSPRNHAYARRPVDVHPDFYAFWADGNPDSISISRLYFTNRAGDVWMLPYEMDGETARPEPLSRIP